MATMPTCMWALRSRSKSRKLASRALNLSNQASWTGRSLVQFFRMAGTLKINRAPVLTLWGAVVAERLGYARDEALTPGKAVAGRNAQSKGQRLGIYHPPSDEEK